MVNPARGSLGVSSILLFHKSPSWREDCVWGHVAYKLIVFVVVTSAGVLGFLVTGSAAEANGSVKWYEKKNIGPYEIGLGTVPQSPSPGVVHFTVYVADIETGARYTDVDVKFTMTAH